jgi:MFS family permease
MTHASVVELCAAVCPWLALVWCLQRVARLIVPPLRRWTLLAVTGAIAVVVLLLPVQGLVVARWVAGLNANFSIPLTVMLAVIVWERVFERSLLSEREWATAWSFGAIGGLALYPMALGLGSFDPYEWGWRFSPLFVAIGALTVVLVWTQNRFGFLLVLAAVAFQLRLLESTNYWDYLLDPVYSLVSIVWLARGFVTSMRISRTKRYSKTLPPNISTI